jgi:hypothetical protein
MRKSDRELDRAKNEYTAARSAIWPDAEKALAKDWDRTRAQNEQQQEQEHAAQQQKSKGLDWGR